MKNRKNSGKAKETNRNASETNRATDRFADECNERSERSERAEKSESRRSY